VTPAGGGSGVCGGAVPVHGGVVVDLRGLAGLRSVDDVSLVADVAAGTFGHTLEAELRQDHAATLGHRPQSIAISTVGGWLACRSAGQYSTRYGKIEDMVVGLDVALADGQVIRTGGAPRAATGPDLTQLFVGSEGTLGVITGARLRLHPAPASEQRAAYRFGSFPEGVAACRRALRRGATPAVLRLYDEAESKQSFDDPGPLLVVLDEGDPSLVEATMAVVAEECAVGGAEDLGPHLADRWVAHRDDVYDLDDLARQGVAGDTMEVAARWAALPSLYDDVTSALREVDGTVWASAHLSHAYTDGACLYFSLAGRGDGWYVSAWDAAAGTALAHGAALSHHHGVGLAKARFLAAALGPAHAVLAGLKRALDPAGVLNPGKLGLPDRFGAPDWPRP
ncbi:MAG: FAD-binding oxidoreductase, partial [Actinomycetota bacterium]|nr:FAD-binding oxidoreductase [Actinomycetota bacterium]